MESMGRKHALALRSARAVATSCDTQVAALIEDKYERFDQWKRGVEINGRSRMKRIGLALDHVLSRLLGARDYEGAAQALSVLYYRFALSPARCVQASLEIIRNHPQQHKDDLIQFYRTALKNGRLDQLMVLKEMLTLYIVLGEYHDAYSLYKEEMQELDVHQDAHLQGTIGMVCYWLLFIESEELRSRFGHAVARDSEAGWADGDAPWTARLHSGAGDQSLSAEDVLVSRYQFKPTIGVHILYQEAVGAFRRAIASSSDSAVFVEYYSRLLVLSGDVDAACDQLEHFYFSHPSDPHATRMLASFLSTYYPESSGTAQVYLSWLENDPTNGTALRKVMQLTSARRIDPGQCILALAGALDSFGSDVHLAQSPATASALWTAFAYLLSVWASASPPDVSVEAAVSSIRVSRDWWMSSFFSRPTCLVSAQAFIEKFDSFADLLIEKALIAHQLFGKDALHLARLLHRMLQTDSDSFSRGHVADFHRHFSGVDLSESTQERPVVSDQTMDVSVRVLNRSLIAKDTRHAAGPSIAVTRRDSDASDDFNVVDQELIAALQEAVRCEVGDNDATNPGRSRKRSLAQVEADLVRSDHAEMNIAVPLYVDVLEELLYKTTKLPMYHIQVQLHNYLQEAGATIPSWLEVKETFKYLQQRWIGNDLQHGHPGLLLRYEAFVVRYMRKHAKSSQYWATGVSDRVVHECLREMSKYVSRSHIHFPQLDEAKKWMGVKASRFLRARRRLLRDYTLAMRYVASQHDYIDTKDLVETVMTVGAQNSHADLLAVEDIERQAKAVLVQRHAYVVRGIAREYYRKYLDEYVHLDTIYNPVEVRAALKRRYHKMKKVTLDQVKAFLWLKRWEVENPGRFYEFLDDDWARQKHEAIVLRGNNRI